MTLQGIQQTIKSPLITLLLLGIVLIGSSNAENFPLLRNLSNKKKLEIYEQVETLQMVADQIEGLVVNKGNKFNSGDYSLWYFQKEYGDLIGCNLCWYTTSELDSVIRNPQVEDVFASGFIGVCSMVLRESTCAGYFDQLANVIVNNILKLVLTPQYMCAEVLQYCASDPYIDLDPKLFITQMLSDKPANIYHDNYVNNLYQQILNDPNKDSRPTLKMVQFTDIHMDLQYTQGASIHCDNIICCRPGDGFPNDTESQAGPYGSPGCDIPLDVVTSMGEYINQNLKPDIIFWTGDVAPHDQWAYNLSYVTGLQTRLADFFKANFSDYSLYPLEGNHDFETANSQDFTTVDPMIQVNLQLWDQYLDENAKQMYAKAGYYTQKLKLKNGKVYDKVNIVAINTQPCYNMNFFLFSQRDDPGDVLAWLNETFRQIEAAGEMAIIISHVPPGDSSCLYQWSVRYKSIMDRFQHLIRFSIFGHVHSEIFGVAPAINSSKPIGVHYWAASVSTWVENNPSFRMFEVDEETMLPIKAHTYILNIRNETNPTWKWHHEITEYYNMTDLSPDSFIALSNQMNVDEQVALRYMKAMSAQGKATDYDSCDEVCRKNLYCSTVNTVYFESKDCMGLERFDIKNDPISTVMEYLSDPWVVKNPQYNWE